jgi:hypothetical protein
MNKNWLVFAFLFIVILVTVSGYWLGYNAGSTHRFVSHPDDFRVALDTKTGQMCFTRPPADKDVPLCKNIR